MKNGAEGEKNHNAGVLHPHSKNVRGIGEKMKKGFNTKEAQHNEEQGMYPGKDQAVGDGAVRLVPVTGAQVPGNVGIDAHSAPTATARIRFWMGKAKLTAFMASVLIRATNRLSTILYRDWMSMERMGGAAMDMSKGKTGRVPILLVCWMDSGTGNVLS